MEYPHAWIFEAIVSTSLSSPWNFYFFTDWFLHFYKIMALYIRYVCGIAKITHHFHLKKIQVIKFVQDLSFYCHYNYQSAHVDLEIETLHVYVFSNTFNIVTKV